MKHVYQMIPVSLYDIPGLERWLEEQADRGLFPVHLGSYASFRRDGVPGTRFRLEPFGKTGTEPTPEQLELYREWGWAYALSLRRAYYLFYAVDPAAPELYTDLVTRGQSLDRLAKKSRLGKWHHILYPILLLLPILAAFFLQSRFDVQPDHWARLPLILLHLFKPGFLIALGCLIFFFRIDFRNYRILLRTHERLRQGLPPPPTPGPSRKIARENLIFLVLTPILAVVLAGTWLSGGNLPLERFSRPYVVLADLENEPLASYEELFGPSSFRNENSQAQRSFSLLAPAWYTVEQNGYSLQAGSRPNSFSPDPQDGEFRYSPTLDMEYFRLILPALARPVAHAQLDAFRLVNVTWFYEEAEYPGVDFVILAKARDRVWQMAALGRGGRVAVFRYAGQQDLADHLDELAAMVR